MAESLDGEDRDEDAKEGEEEERRYSVARTYRAHPSKLISAVTLTDRLRFQRRRKFELGGSVDRIKVLLKRGNGEAGFFDVFPHLADAVVFVGDGEDGSQRGKEGEGEGAPEEFAGEQTTLRDSCKDDALKHDEKGHHLVRVVLHFSQLILIVRLQLIKRPQVVGRALSQKLR